MTGKLNRLRGGMADEVAMSRMDFLAMKKLEASVKRAVRGANSSSVVAFPVFKRWTACKRHRQRASA